MPGIGLIGERLDEAATPAGQYRRVPPIADSWLADGRPLDAGTVQCIDSNLSHLSFEGLRHLYSGPGFGGLKSVGHGWNSLVDGSPMAGYTIGVIEPTGLAQEAEISWSQAIARRSGPFPGIQDRALVTGGAALRTVRIIVRAKSGTNAFPIYSALGSLLFSRYSLDMYFALTRSSAPPDQGLLAFAKVNIAATTDTQFEVALSAPEGLTGGRAPWRCRADATAGAVQTQVPEYWVWVGCRSCHADDAHIATSVFESYTGTTGVGFGILR